MKLLIGNRNYSTWSLRPWLVLKHFDIPFEDAEYAPNPVYSDWYDTAESQRILGYQNTSFPQFLELLREAVEVAING